MIFIATVPSANGSRPSAKFARGRSPSSNPCRSSSIADTAASLSKVTFPSPTRGGPPGAGEIQRVEVVEPLVPGGLERRPERPAIDAAVAVAVARETPERREQL